MTSIRVFLFIPWVLLPALVVAVGCDSGEATGDRGDPAPSAIAPHTSGIRVAWDARTQIPVELDGASYPRLARTADGDLLVGYDRGGQIILRRSTDDGRSWGERQLVADDTAEGVSLANAELTRLENGTMLLAYNARAGGNLSRRYALKVMASTDGGRTWAARATVFEAGRTGERGVWEPIIRQLSSGTLQLYAANEYPYANSDDQEITMWRSTDQGRSWSDGTTVSYRPGHRDGMPVPLLLQDGGIALAIEDNGMGGPFKPAIIHTPSTDPAWQNGPIGASSDQRWRALAPGAQLSRLAYGGAPYLAQFPQGETLLSFQSTEGRTTGGDPVGHSTMAVGIGTPAARDFSRLSYPFDVPPGDRAVWNALFVKDSTTVTALTTTTAFADTDRQQLYIIDGHRLPEPSVPQAEVTVDGQADESVWTGRTIARAGAYAEKTVDAQAAWTPTHLFLYARVTDAQPPSTGETLEDEAVVLAVAPDSLARNELVDGAFRLRVNAAGDGRLDAGRDGTWQTVSGAGVEVAVSPPEPASTPAFDGTRHTIEVRVPWSALKGAPAVGVPFGFTVGIMDDDIGESTTEYTGGTTGERPATWLRARLVE